MTIYSSITGNNQKVVTTEVCSNWWLNKQKVTNPHNGILFNHTKEKSTHTYFNRMNCENAKLKKSVNDHSVLYDSTYVKSLE